MQIELENFRGFSEKIRFDLPSLTLVTGENSSGKSSFLAAISCALDSEFPFSLGVFNRTPFELGNYSTIASYRGGRGRRADSFSISAQIDGVEKGGLFEEFSGQPALKKWWLKSATKSTVIESIGETRAKISIDEDGKSIERVVEILPQSGQADRLSPIAMYRALGAQQKNEKGEKEDLASRLLYGFPISSRSRVISLAPVRTKPRRTYDQIGEEFRPEGDHIPFQLSRIWSDTTRQSEALRSALLEFGKNSGLFDKLEVKKLGKQSNIDPFQILLKVGVPQVNLADVGYGVSQALPLVYECLRQSRGQEILLIQQPEVHLHPRAQAALGSFLAQVIVTQKKRLIVETHSDYLIDRIRLEVSKRRLGTNDVSLLFFERKKSQTCIHQMGIDDMGNITDAPASYGQFFLDEQHQLLGI